MDRVRFGDFYGQLQCKCGKPRYVGCIDYHSLIHGPWWGEDFEMYLNPMHH